MSRPSARLLKDFMRQETPTGLVNGSNTVFAIAQAPDENDSIMLFKNGILQMQSTDYTISGQTLTFVTAPAVVSDLVCIYISKDGE